MSNDRSQLMTAREAAKVLRVTERMIGHYANDGKLRTYREGRRVWYLAEDVEVLAQTLRADLRPTQITTQDLNAELTRYVRNRSEQDAQLLEAQRNLQEAQQQLAQGQQELTQGQQGLTQGQREMLERLERIEQQVKRGPTWQQAATIAVVVLAVLVILFLLFLARGG